MRTTALSETAFSRFLTGLTATLGAIALVFAFMAAASGPAKANSDPEAFTQSLIDQGVGILKNNPAGPARNAKFKSFLLQYADAKRTALFTLGAYRRGASQADLDAFQQTFVDYATAVYESRLEQYSGESLKVTGKVAGSSADVVVNAIVVGGAGGGDPLKVAFRLSPEGSAYKFIDIQVAGIWLSVEQRDQFGAFLSQNGGSIQKLTEHLKGKTQALLRG